MAPASGVVLESPLVRSRIYFLLNLCPLSVLLVGCGLFVSSHLFSARDVICSLDSSLSLEVLSWGISTDLVLVMKSELSKLPRKLAIDS